MPKKTESPAPKSRKSAAKSQPSYEQIAARAYQIYLERGATPGDPMQDWLRAELELSVPAKSRKPRASSKVITFAA